MPSKRTTHRSTTGKKLYAVRDTEGQFKDIQTFERAHSQDLKSTSKTEAASAATKTKKKAKKAGKKAAKKATKKAAKKSARKA